MDKLLLSLSLVVLLAALTVNSAPMSTSKIISAIEQQQQQQQQRQRKFGQLTKTNNEGDDDDDGGDDNEGGYIKIENVDVQKGGVASNKNANLVKEYINDLRSMAAEEAAAAAEEEASDNNGQFMGRYNIIDEMRKNRQNKMIGYFNYNPYYAAAAAVPYSSPSPVYYPPEFFDDFAAFYGYSDDDEIMSRQNPGRRRPGNFKNSPIYYIRLPPTPYMFVPGLGYISQPPSYAPMAPPPPPAISSFYNLPIDFISNGKPTNIYQYQSPAFAPQQFIPQTPPPPPPSYPMYQRPQRPYHHESKVTNLKGAFLFNGRPEEIFVLPPSSIYPDPRFISPFY